MKAESSSRPGATQALTAMVISPGFLPAAVIAIVGIAGCSKDRQVEASPISGSDAREQQRAGETPGNYIFRIYDEFIAAEAVARQCGVSTPELEAQHKKIFHAVDYAVRHELANNYGKAESALDEFLHGHDEMIRARTLQVLKSHPCNSSDVQVLVERYKLQSRWKVPAGS